MTETSEPTEPTAEENPVTEEVPEAPVDEAPVEPAEETAPEPAEDEEPAPEPANEPDPDVEEDEEVELDDIADVWDEIEEATVVTPVPRATTLHSVFVTPSQDVLNPAG